MNRNSLVALALSAGVVALVYSRRRPGVGAGTTDGGTQGGGIQGSGTTPPAGASSAQLRAAFDEAVAQGQSAAFQRLLWNRYAAALRAEGRSVPSTPVFVDPPPRRLLYCQNPAGCPLRIEPTETAATIFTVPAGVQVRELEVRQFENGPPWHRVRHPAGVILRGTTFHDGWVRADAVAVVPPSPPPASSTPLPSTTGPGAAELRFAAARGVFGPGRR